MQTVEEIIEEYEEEFQELENAHRKLVGSDITSGGDLWLWQRVNAVSCLIDLWAGIAWIREKEQRSDYEAY